MPSPLVHYRILDLSRILAGPFCTQLLADFGAEVVKVEPATGDPARTWGPPFEDGETGESAYFQSANRGKRSRMADLRDPAHLKRLHEILSQTDVLVENFLPDTAERLGLDWEEVHQRHPRLIVASIRGFASDVEASRRAGYDFIIQAEAGWMAATGTPDGPPTKTPAALVDVLAALYAANGIQAALLHRERTGEALHIEVPLMEAALAGMVNVAASTLMTGEAPVRMGNAHPNIAPYQTFACQGGEIALGVGSDRQFEMLALWLGLDLEDEPQWRTNPGRVQDRDRLAARLADIFCGLERDTVLTFCGDHAIPASPIRDLQDALFHQAGRLHRLIQPLLEVGSGRMVPTLASPVLLNGQRACASLPPPRWSKS